MNKSSLKTLDVLEFFLKHRKKMKVSEIAACLEIPRSSIRDILNSLTFKNYLIYDKQEKKYELSTLKILEITSEIKNDISELPFIMEEMKLLSDEYNETVFYAKEIDFEIIYIAKIEGNNSIRTTAQLGIRKQLYSTGLGKAILSTFDASKLDNYLEDLVMVPKTKNTIITEKELRSNLKLVKERGYAIDYAEGEEHLLCVAAPIKIRGEVLGAISLAGLYNKEAELKIEKKGKKILETAKKLSKKLEYLN